MPNHLSSESSPYLQQHADNPVDWYPWGEEAFEAAREQDKPIFLSIGYATCHWCHVMEHESFEDDATAALSDAGTISLSIAIGVAVGLSITRNTIEVSRYLRTSR